MKKLIFFMKSIKYIMASPYKEQHDSYFMKTYANSMQVYFFLKKILFKIH